MEPTASPPARPLRADAQRNRARILDAAAATFAELGVGAVMEEVARRAEVGVGTLYRHYPTKDALIGELVAEQFRRFNARAVEALAIEDPWKAIADTLTANAESMAANLVVQDVMTKGDGWVWDYAGEPLQELIETFDVLVKRGQQAGVVRADLRAVEIPMLMRGLCSTMATNIPGISFVWRRHLEILLDGLRA